MRLCIPFTLKYTHLDTVSHKAMLMYTPNKQRGHQPLSGSRLWLLKQTVAVYLTPVREKQAWGGGVQTL